jgi:UDP-N-acetylmuramoylalanine--D-glutamate ligase
MNHLALPSDIESRRILILGFGREGQSTYKFFRQLWPLKDLLIADERPMANVGINAKLSTELAHDRHVATCFGPDYLSLLTQCDLVMKTPGISDSLPALAAAVNRGLACTSQSDLLLRYYPRDKIIGVTGTKGKSTTTTLIWTILRHAGIDAVLAGNVGIPILSNLDALNRGALFVCEFSSYQLANICRSPHIGVILNVVPEHLTYHGSFDRYVEAKKNLCRFQNQADFVVFNADYELPTVIAHSSLGTQIGFSLTQPISFGCFVDRSSIYFCRGSSRIPILDCSEAPLIGRFNLQNIMAAVAVAALYSVPPLEIAEAIKGFRPLPHRLQPVGTYHGITFYDDSIATVPEAAQAAIESLGAIVQTLIAGGHDRQLDFSEFGRFLISSSVEHLILFRPTGSRIEEAVIAASKELNLRVPGIYFVDSMAKAIELSFQHTGKGKACLLSPASPSFGIFRDYQDRGDTFARLAREYNPV